MTHLSKELQPGILQNLRYDLPAGMVVFLVALPLCLGIALASNAPLFAGLISGAVAGIIVGLFSGSSLSVSGPAAGLTVIVASSIDKLGSFEVFLLALILSGLLQIALGFIRAGIIGEFVPTSVVKGMLAAIGIVIILKQIPYALGKDPDYEGSLRFLSISGSNTITDILAAFMSFTPAAVGISLFSLLLLALWDQKPFADLSLTKFLPGPLVVVFFGVIANELLRVFWGDMALRSDVGHLVKIPITDSFASFQELMAQPRFSEIFSREVWIVAFTIAIVGSIESLLSVEASDKLDPYRRTSDMNKELRAQGIGNLLAGLLGGIPVTSVIIRSSTNIYAGARTRVATVVHGVFLIGTVVLIPHWLNKIPLASLAAILIYVGYRLTRPELFRKMKKAGKSQFVPFFVTVLAIVFTDLLTGVLIGFIVGLFFVIRANYHAAFTLVHSGNTYLLRFNKDLSFVNKYELKEALRMLPEHSSILIDGTQSLFIDQDIFDVIDDFLESAKHRHITIELKRVQPKVIPAFNAIVRQSAA